MSILKKYYFEKIVPYFLTTGQFKNKMSIPILLKVVLNVGFNSSKIVKGDFEVCRNNLTLLSGQHSVFTRSKKSISNFKLRENDIVGCKVTLRRDNMYNFLERLLFIVIPRIRDFRGLSKNSFDGKGNYTIGIKEQLVFPEIVYENVEFSTGLDITIVTNTNDDLISFKLFELFNFPFKK